MPVPRRISREAAFQSLYSLFSSGESLHNNLEKIIQMPLLPESEDILTHRLDEFGKRVLEVYFENSTEIEELLDTVLEKWDPERLTKTDGTILRLGTTELLFFPEVPYKVVINEYIEMAKKYGDDDSPSFINGILDKVHREKTTS